MALKSDRSTLQTDISFFMNEAATRGGVAVLSAGGSGASMDNGTAVVTYVGASGDAAVGLLLNDMVDIDLTRQHLNQHKDEVQKGGKVTLLTKGWVVTNSLDGTPAAGGLAFMGQSGNIATAAFAATLDGGQESKHIVGRFTSAVDQNGYAKVFIDLPNTNNNE